MRWSRHLRWRKNTHEHFTATEETRGGSAGRQLLELQGRGERSAFLRGLRKNSAVARRVGLFPVFQIAAKSTIDPAELEGQFHILSWKLHPDNFVRAGEFERNLSRLERSSELNDAYRTLREPISRVEYLLEHLGVRKEGTTKQQAPPELLEEVFELNESLG